MLTYTPVKGSHHFEAKGINIDNIPVIAMPYNLNEVLGIAWQDAQEGRGIESWSLRQIVITLVERMFFRVHIQNNHFSIYSGANVIMLIRGVTSS